MVLSRYNKKFVAVSHIDPLFISDNNNSRGTLSAARINEIFDAFKKGDLSAIEKFDLSPWQRIAGFTPLQLVAYFSASKEDLSVKIAQYFLDKLESHFTDKLIAKEEKIRYINDIRGPFNRSALHWSCIKNNLPLTQWLIKNGALNQPDVLGDTPFHRAATSADPVLLDTMYKQFPGDLERRNNDLQTPLVRAIADAKKIHPGEEKERLARLQQNITFLLSKNASQTTRDIYGQTYKDYEQLNITQNRDPHIPQKDIPSNAEALIALVNQGDLEGVKESVNLLKNSVRKPVNYLNDTLLNTASFSGQTEILAYLLTLPGADINHQNIEKKGPLYWSVYNGNTRSVQLLLDQQNIQVDTQESILKETALHRAVINRRADIMTMLLNRKASPNAQNIFGQTALHLSVSGPYVDPDIVNKLLLSGADTTIKDKQGHTAADVAEAMGHTAMAKRIRLYPAIDSISSAIRDLQQKTAEKKLTALAQKIKEAMKTISEQHGQTELSQLIPFSEALNAFEACSAHRAARKELKEVIKTIAGTGYLQKKAIVEAIEERYLEKNSSALYKLLKSVNKVQVQADIPSKVSKYDPSESGNKSTIWTTVRTTDKKPYTALAMDGGGIRGIISGMVAAKIEKETHKPLAESFRLFTGTSTGAILATAYTTPGASRNVPRFSTYDALDIYIRQGSDIFPKRWWIPGRDLFSIRYSPAPLEKLAQNFFGNHRLSESLSDVIVSTYDAATQTPYFFSTFDAKENPMLDPLTRDVVRATSAAPTFFPPKIMGDHIFLDGGVSTNNPAMKAYKQAKKLGYKEEEMFIVSLGTGEPERGKISDWTLFHGELFWASTIPGVAMEGPNWNVHSDLTEIFSLNPKNYHRFQATLETPIRLDGVDPENIVSLVEYGEKLIEDSQDQINYVVETLLK